VGIVERIFATLQKPQEWRSFYEHDLPLLTRLDREVQDLAIAERLNKSQADALHTLKREAPQKFRDVSETGGLKARDDLLDWRTALAEVPCWVRDMDDEAFMQLVLCNAQGELSALEQGIHVLQAVENGGKGRSKKGGIRAYVRAVGKAETYLRQLRQAAEVYRIIIAAIHKAPRDTWPVLAQALLQQGWSVDETEAAVARVKGLFAVIPDWWTRLDRPSLAGLVALKESRGLQAMFQVAGDLAERLEPVTIYVLLETEDREVRDGREYRRFATVAEAYDPRTVFCSRLQASLTLPDAATVRQVYTATNMATADSVG
jgi:hypothetical protein